MGPKYYTTGHGDCEQLATGRPKLAVTNAENYVYFALSDPRLKRPPDAEFGARIRK